FGVGGLPLSVAVGDFNLDGKPDLATANFSSNNVSVLLGQGSGGFGAATNFAVGLGPESVAVGDFNLDGKPDLATANASSDNVSVLLGQGSGGFGAATNPGVGDTPVSVAVGDFNLDGKPDLATANFSSNNVSVLLGNDSGGFGAAANFAVGNFPTSVAVGDFNLDGKPDLATANAGPDNVSVLLGQGSGGFGAATNFAVGVDPHSVAVGDFNLDGMPDLATANQGSNNVSVLLNSCTSNTSPVAQCQNVTVSAGASCTANASINNGSYDPDSGDTITLTQSPAGPYPLGTTTVTLTVTDNHGASSSCTATVTVVDNTKPVINAPANINVSTGAGATSCGVVVSDVTLGPATATDNCSGNPAVTRMNVPPGNLFPVGATTIIFTATDAAGNSQTEIQIVTVTDNTLPVITLNGANPMAVQCATGFSDPGATATDNCAASVPVTASGNVNISVPGSFTITYTANDGRGNTATKTRTVNVLDTTAPAITLNGANPMTVQCATGFTDPGATATDNCAPSAPVTASGSVNTSVPGSYTITYTARDGVGNQATKTRTVNVVDTTAPVINCPANIITYLPLNSTDTSKIVNFAVTATDACGSASVTTSRASGSAFPLGTTTVTATANDGRGNTSTCSFTVTVRYNFTGFFPPVDNPPVVNSVNAGQPIPVKFSLSGNKGLAIFAAGYPVSQPIGCSSGSPTSETVTAGSSSLSYDATTDRYNYVWKTDKAWKGTCRQLVVKLNDGTTHVANFQFK
ncbi:MAG: PxKF domain-containing protein, partial [Blastocatellia bacterium]